MAITRLTSSALPGQRVSTAPATLGGYDSYTGLWVGGAAATTVPGGYRSYLAFWIGGAGAAVAEPPTPSPPPSVDNDFSALFGFSGGNPFIEDDRDRAKKVWLRREDEEIMIIISCL